MLAAAPKRQDKSLDLFCLALTLICKKEDNIPASLKTYFEEVVSQARVLARDPTQVQGRIMPEAIQLALEMRRAKQFSTQIEGVNGVDSVTPEIAGNILSAVETSFVCQG
jgi:hypothetical protein